METISVDINLYCKGKTVYSFRHLKLPNDYASIIMVESFVAFLDEKTKNNDGFYTAWEPATPKDWKKLEVLLST
jgi:hypothetical protein